MDSRRALLVALLASLLLFTETLLEKTNYRVIVNTLDKCDKVKRLAYWTKMKVSRKGRYNTTFKGTAEISESIADQDLEILVEGYRNTGNTLTDRTFHFVFDACKEIEKNHTYMQPIIEGSDLPTKCPFKKGLHKMNVNLGIILDTSGLIPTGNFHGKAEVVQKGNNISIFCASTNFDILVERL